MQYQAELDFLMKTLERMNLQTLLLTPETVNRLQPDLGLRRMLNLQPLYEQAISQAQTDLRPNAIYKLVDEFSCHYFYLRLPETADVYLLVGPYRTTAVTRERLLEAAEHFRIDARRFAQFEMCYGAIPVLRDDRFVFSLLSTFGETLWGKGNAFEYVERSAQESPSPTILPLEDSASDPEELHTQMRALERRYQYENELMNLVSQGLTTRAEQMLRGFSQAVLAQRSPDPLRNVKNYCIICNTLLRKAAQQGGVHPLQLDQSSAALAQRIENLGYADDGLELLLEMVRIYCRLVRKHAVGNYPPLVQRTLTYIDSNLAGDLSLQAIARTQNVSGSYLSNLFHKEYGKTLSEYILEKRVENAAALLRNTHLQVQTVAQHCGFSDVNYFSKTFKKHHGLTPRQYRQQRTAGL